MSAYLRAEPSAALESTPHVSHASAAGDCTRLASAVTIDRIYSSTITMARPCSRAGRRRLDEKPIAFTMR